MKTCGGCKSGKAFKKGFSLIELIIVIAIMTVLIGLIAPNFVQYVKKNKEKACRENREAILAVYQRCVYDTSIQALGTKGVTYDNDGLKMVIPGASGTVTFKPVEGEVKSYNKCPVDKSSTYDGTGNFGVDAASGTAWIKCPECGDIVSIDMTGGFKKANPSPEPDKPIPTNEPVPSPTPNAEYTVTFNNMGHGDTVPSQTVTYLTNFRATNPGSLSAPYYTFGGWFDNASCTGSTFDFSTQIDHNMTLYAKWTHNSGNWPVWPYQTDKTWWDAESFAHGADVTGQNITSGASDKYVNLKVPTGIFKSKSGAEFVGVEASGQSIQIYEYEAESPEYYSALHPNYLIQLSGNVKTYDLTKNAINNGQQVRITNLTNGDLIKFVDGSNTYYYVFWHNSETAQTVNVSEIRNYDPHPGNCYRVSSTASSPYVE